MVGVVQGEEPIISFFRRPRACGAVQVGNPSFRFSLRSCVQIQTAISSLVYVSGETQEHMSTADLEHGIAGGWVGGFYTRPA